jgi:hypothetical protein
MKTATAMIGCAALVMALTVPASADWFPGDPYKMHFPQLPDPTGWDVNGTEPMILADDFQCSETGPISDVHVWGSWHFGNPGSISSIRLSIFDNVPEDPTNPDSYSQPGTLLWAQSFAPGDYTLLDPYGTGQEGWYDPATGVSQRPDHDTFHQLNFTNIKDPFVQQFGEIYWLAVSVTVDPSPTGPEWGWKTSQDHFMDNAVWYVPGTGWSELYDPEVSGQPLDLAFVITPEPGTLALLLLGGLALVSRKRRARA